MSARVPSGDQLVDGADDAEIGGQRSALQLRTRGQNNAERGKHCLEFFDRHVGPIELHVEDLGFALRFERAGQVSDGFADFDIALGEVARLLVEIDVDRMLDDDRLRRGGTFGRELQLVACESPNRFGHAAIGIQSSIEARQARNSASGIDEA